MKRLLAAILALSVASSGCTGSFALTKKVYNAHRSQDDKWADEFIFLVVAILPIYGLATLGDAIIFNSIEFWTGENPVEEAKIKTDDGKDLRLTYNRSTDEITIHTKDPITFKRGSDMVMAKNGNGGVIYSAASTTKGDIALYDSQLNLVKNVSSSSVERLTQQYLQ